MPYLDNGTTLDADGPLNLARVEAFLLTIEKGNNLDFSIIFNSAILDKHWPKWLKIKENTMSRQRNMAKS